MRQETLSAEEWALICGLRDIPAGLARGELMRFVQDLIAFVGDPRCAEAQGDGVPCRSIHEACEQCQHVGEVIARLHGRLTSARPAVR